MQKQSASLKAYKKWFKALLESSQALVDGRNEAADLDKELKLREKDLQVPHCLPTCWDRQNLTRLTLDCGGKRGNACTCRCWCQRRLHSWTSSARHAASGAPTGGMVDRALHVLRKYLAQHSSDVAGFWMSPSTWACLHMMCAMRRPAEGGAIEGEEPSQAEPAAADGVVNGVADVDPPLPPQEEAGGWSAVQDAGNGAASDTTAARFAPGAKFVVNTA